MHEITVCTSPGCLIGLRTISDVCSGVNFLVIHPVEAWRSAAVCGLPNLESTQCCWSLGALNKSFIELRLHNGWLAGSLLLVRSNTWSMYMHAPSGGEPQRFVESLNSLYTCLPPVPRNPDALHFLLPYHLLRIPLRLCRFG